MDKNDDVITKSITLAGDFFTDVAEIGLDSMLESINANEDLLAQIPIFKWLVLGNKARSLIQTAFFVKKYSCFIGIISSEINKSNEELEKLTSLYVNDKKYKKLIEYTIIALDRYQTELKAKILGMLFTKTFNEMIFTIEEYNTLLYSIENIHPYTGLECLKDFYEYKQRYVREVDTEQKNLIWAEGAKLDYSPLTNTGLLYLPTGGSFTGDLGGACINEFGEKFYTNIIMNIKNFEDER